MGIPPSLEYMWRPSGQQQAAHEQQQAAPPNFGKLARRAITALRSEQLTVAAHELLAC